MATVEASSLLFKVGPVVNCLHKCLAENPANVLTVVFVQKYVKIFAEDEKDDMPFRRSDKSHQRTIERNDKNVFVFIGSLENMKNINKGKNESSPTLRLSCS